MASRLRNRPALAAAALLGLLGAPPLRTAAAQARPAGAVSAVALVGDERSAPDGRSATSGAERADYGAGAIVDLFHEVGLLRVGGALGVAAVSSADGVRSRVYMPLAASVSLLLPLGGGVGLDLRGRLGAWAGATDAGLDADLFAALGAWLALPLGGRARLGLGVDVWFQRAELRPGERGVESYVAPGLALVWDATPSDEPPPDEPPPQEPAAPESDAPGAPRLAAPVPASLVPAVPTAPTAPSSAAPESDAPGAPPPNAPSPSPAAPDSDVPAPPAG